MKKTIKKIMSLSLSVVMIAGLAAGLSSCGANKRPVYTEDGRVIVRLWSHITQDSDPADIEAHNETLKYWEETFPHIKVEEIPMSAGTDYRQEYDKALMANNAPDMVSIFSYTDIPSRIKNGTVADITDLVEKWDLKQQDLVVETLDEAITKDGRWYAIPMSTYVMGNLYNTTILKNLGEDVNNLPKTWQEFAELGQRVTDLSVPRLGYELVGMDWCAWPFTVWVWSAGGEMVRENEDGTYALAFNEEPAVDAAEFLNKMIWEYGATQKNILADMEDIRLDVQSGTAVSSFFGLGDVINKDSTEKYGITQDDFLMTPIPPKDESIKPAVLSGGEVITFNPKADPVTLEAAWEIAMSENFNKETMITTFEKAAEDGNINVQLPARKDLVDVKFDIIGVNEANQASVKEMMEIARPEPFCQHWADLKSALVKPLQEIYTTQGITRDEIKAKLDACAEELYQLYPDTFVKPE